MICLSVTFSTLRPENILIKVRHSMTHISQLTSQAEIKNLIFDLGGVILDLSVESTLHSFSALSGHDVRKVKELFIGTAGFYDFEKGLIDEKSFRDVIRKVYAVEATDEAIDKAWNAMLGGLPQSKLELIKKLKSQYRVYLLSNTNTIHLNHINANVVPNTGESSLDVFFHKAYYSHLMKKRKPDADIYLQVLEENNLKPHETLFLDDNAENVAGAQAVGIHSVHVNTPDFILTYFHA